MKIVVVDDQTLVRKGVISIISSDKKMKVTGEAENKQEALMLIQKEQPDLTIVDFHLESDCGLDVITEARQIGATCKFAVLTYSKDLMAFARAMDLEVDGYISLNAEPEELVYALQVIKRGRKYYDPDIIDLLMHPQPQKRPRVDHNLVEKLTTKEREVLEKLGMGFTNRQISESLFITENTVKKHVSHVLSKLNLGDRTQAALYANQMGLVR